jgi:hypothetical protein
MLQSNMNQSVCPLLIPVTTTISRSRLHFPCIYGPEIHVRLYIRAYTVSTVQLVPYDAVNRNKVSIRQLPYIFFLTHYMFRPLRAILR